MEDFKGLSRDTVREKNPVGTWQFARNILMTRGVLSISNEGGFDFVSEVPGEVIGTIDTNEDIILFSVDESYSYIGIVKTLNDIPVYELVVKIQNLFKKNRPIEGVFYKNYKQETIIIFSDGIFKDSFSPKLINITNIGYTLLPDNELNIVDIEKLNLFPTTKEANIDITYENGSALDVEVCYITFAYVTDDNSTLNYFPIHEVGYPLIEYRKNTLRNIIIKLLDLDNYYSKVKLGIVIKKDGGLLGYESPILSYTGLDLTYTLSSLNSFTSISVDSLIIPTIAYTKVKTLTLTDDEIFLGNVTTEDTIPFQKYANLLELDLLFSVRNSKDYTNPTLCPDEVYAFNISLQLLNGSYTEEFHLPGPIANVLYNELDALTSTDLNNMGLSDLIDRLPLKRFQLINSGGFVNVLPTRIPINSTEAAMRWGYWQNEELYPNNSNYNSTIDYNNDPIIGGQDLRGTPIRYHRVPGLDAIASKMPIRLGYSDKNEDLTPINMHSVLPAFGVQINNFDTIVPIEIKDKIQGYKLSIIKRLRGQTLVEDINFIKQTQIVDTSSLDRHLNTHQAIYGHGLGYITTEPFTDSPYYSTEYGFSKIRSSNLSIYKPTIIARVIKANYAIADLTIFGGEAIATVSVDPFKAVDIEATDTIGTIGNISSILLGGGIEFEPQYLIPDLQRYATISKITYLLGNNLFLDNYVGEEAVILNAYNSLTVGTVNSLRDKWNPFLVSNLDSTVSTQETTLDYYDQGTNSYLSKIVDREETGYLTINTTILNILNNVYSGFNPTSFITIGKVRTNYRELPHLSTPVLFDNYGDIFTNNIVNFVVTHGIGFIDFYQLAIKGLIGVSADSIAYNNIDRELNRSYKHETTDIDVINTFDYTTHIFNLEATRSLNDLIAGISFNIFSSFINIFPNRIHRSLSLRSESLSTTPVRTFLANNYFETLPERGEIIALRGSAKILHIQKRYSLFIARIKDTLINNNDVTFLGVGDLFDREPDEILQDKNKGFIGCSSQFSCTLIKEGLFTIDQEKHKIYIIGGTSVQEISKIGLLNWFINNSNFNNIYKEENINNTLNVIDNPYTQIGYLLGYDVDNARLLITKKDYSFIFEEEFLLGDYIFENGFYRLNEPDSDPIPYSNTNYFTDNSITFSYSLDKNMWVSEHDYYPNAYIHTIKGIYVIENKGNIDASLFKLNSKTSKGLYFGTKYESYVDLIFNGRLDLSKLYQAIEWQSICKSVQGASNYHKTVDSIVIYSDYQCSGEIPISEFNTSRNVEGVWNFNEFRDIVIDSSLPLVGEEGEILTDNLNNNKSYFEKSVFIGTFVVVRLIMKNVNNDSVYINYVNVKSRMSKR